MENQEKAVVPESVLKSVPEPSPEEAAAKVAEKKAAIDALFDQYVADGKIFVDSAASEDLDENGTPKLTPKYVIARFTLDKEEAVGICERLDQVHQFDRIKQVCFANGMIDGITTYLKQIQLLKKPLGMEKPVQIGRYLLDYLHREKQKI